MPYIMNNSLDNLKRFIDNMNTIGLWERIFGWKAIIRRLVYASGDLERLNTQVEGMKEGVAAAENRAAVTNKEIQLLGQINSGLAIENARLKKDDDFRRAEHAHTMASILEMRQQFRMEKAAQDDAAHQKDTERLLGLRSRWSKHEEHVRSFIKAICQRHTIAYIDKAPFKGTPDNTLMICGEYVVFDAKSPGSDELKQFEHYLRDQAEKAVKYARQKEVKPDIFFVVPSNTLETLSTFVYRHGDHNVFIIATDALEPVILNLRKIEDYAFAEQFSPEDRENICRILGRFAHLSKRRIQVDSYFARQFIALAYKCETDLPSDVLETVLEFERSEKLNPPQEKRAKSIPIEELERESNQIRHEAEGKGIVIDEADLGRRLEEVRVYREGSVTG
jgi:hypothetical protein